MMKAATFLSVFLAGAWVPLAGMSYADGDLRQGLVALAIAAIFVLVPLLTQGRR